MFGDFVELSRLISFEKLNDVVVDVFQVICPFVWVIVDRSPSRDGFAFEPKVFEPFQVGDCWLNQQGLATIE
tara:strand:- start:1009 stop:1224 length:216 start_codon:yes stop_codon:yes gene_type:complete